MNSKIAPLLLAGFAIIIPSAAFLTISAVNNTVQSKHHNYPCNIYAEGGTPCVAAHSTTRLLSSQYRGPLYQVIRESDGKTMDIHATTDGYAEAAVQDKFCKGTICRISVIYDQSGHGNDLRQAAPGTFKGPAEGSFNELPIADMAPVAIDGHKAYGVYIIPGMGFRNNNASGLAINNEPEGIYYVVDGDHYDNGCCFDYGNSSTNGKAVGTGTMETAYYGTSTNWGSGNGDGPWIMADMEGGLFSGYNAKKNDVPSIDSWRFVSVFVNGGGTNKWDLRGGDATKNDLTTYYEGIRPGSEDNTHYYPMRKKGGLLLGNGGDNGNGSAGTFYEGVITIGYPNDDVINRVQQNIASAHYADPFLELSRLTTFTPGSIKELNVTFTNSSDKAITDIEFNVTLPKGWKATRTTNIPEKVSIAPGALTTVSYKISAPSKISTGHLTIKAKNGKTEYSHSQRIRCAAPVKINEVCLSGNQFIELYNASEAKTDISGYQLELVRSGEAPVKAMTIPQGTIIGADSFLTIKVSDCYLTSAASKGDKIIYVSVTDLKPGEKIYVEGEEVTVKEIFDGPSEPTTLFIPVSTGPWIEIAKGTTNIPVTSVYGIRQGDKMLIGHDGNYETVTVTDVGKSATQTTLAKAANKGQTTIFIEASDQLEEGYELTIGTGQKKETVTVKQVVRSVSAPVTRHYDANQPHEPGVVELNSPIQNNQINGVDVSCLGSGITFSEPLKYKHRSGEHVQSLGKGILLDRPLEQSHNILSAVNKNCNNKFTFGYPLSTSAGSIALYDATGKVLTDAIVYGSRQSNSSANGTITSPVIATLEGTQKQGGSIAVVPQDKIFFGDIHVDEHVTSLIRIPDGADEDELSRDFRISRKPSPGTKNEE